jgi:integrase
MRVYRRGAIWWFKFRFEGQIIRESAKTSSKTVARDAERARRHELELGVNGLTKRERPLFPGAAKDWLATKEALSPLGLRYYHQYIAKLYR